MAKPHWQECAFPGCRRIYWEDHSRPSYGDCCSLTCTRGLGVLQRNPAKAAEVWQRVRDEDKAIVIPSKRRVPRGTASDYESPALTD